MNKELLQRAKDEAARERGCASWADFKLLNRAFGAVTKKDADLDFILDRAMEIYAEGVNEESLKLLERVSWLVGNPSTNISSSTDLACDSWQKDYSQFKTTKP